MKTSFLKNFFNTKDMGPKNNFNIHSVDLDDSDDVIVCNESFFQRNNSHNIKEVLKNKFMKNEDVLNEKKVNLFSLNDSTSSISSCDIKSPMMPNNFNLSKMRDSPLNSPLFDRNKSIKSKDTLEFITPTSIGAILKTPKRDDKALQFQSFKAKELCSPSMKFMSSNNLTESSKNYKSKFSTSPIETKTVASPSIAKLKLFEKDDNNNKKFPNTLFKSQSSEKYSTDHPKIEYNDDKRDKQMQAYEKLNNHENVHRNQPESLDLISELISNEKSIELNSSSNEVDFTEIEDSKLKVLHMKLKLESEKIQKWKDNIEKELMQKTKKISESEKIIESLRSSNLDLQMRQENISLNYREEIECRSEVSKKIENSRHLCNLLKEKIADIEDLNLHHNKENENMKLVQEQILYVMSVVSDDIKHFSESQFKILTKLKNEITLRDKEIENMKQNISEQKKSAEHEIEKLCTEIKSLEDKLLFDKEQYTFLKIENEKNCLSKDESQELLSKEKALNAILFDDKTNLIDQLANLMIVNENIKEENINFVKEVDAKENIINQLSNTLTELNLDYSNFKIDIEHSNSNFEKLLKERDEAISNLNIEVSLKDEKIKESIESSILICEEMNLKISFKDVSITNLTKNLLEKEEQISNLEESILKLSGNTKELEDALHNSKLENNCINKNASLLKSSNQDLREELNNYKVEMSEHTEEIILLRNELVNLKNNATTLKDESENYQKLIEELQEENSSQKSDLDVMKMKLSRIGETNQQLKTSFDDLTVSSKILLEEKNNEIKNLTMKYESIILIGQKCDSEMELKLKECSTLQNDVNSERAHNSHLMELCEQLRDSIVTKENDLSATIIEKNELNNLNLSLSNKNVGNDLQIKEYEALMAENKSKISSLETFVDDLSKDKQNILKSREDLRKELMFTLEQCKNEHDVLEKKRNKEIENLKGQINSLLNNSSNNTKKSKNKINDLQTLITHQKDELTELQKEMKNILSEKNAVSKNFEISNFSVKELSDNISLKERLLLELNLEKENLKNLLSEYESKLSVMSKDLIVKTSEIIKLKEIELEYHELKNNIITNSPPISTQVPDFIKTCGSATPKSQRLSSRLQFINSQNLDGQVMIFEKQTPQKTPKGILRQPGSASKRRRVIFEDSNVIEQSIDLCENCSPLSDGVDIDLEDINHKKDFSMVTKSPNHLNAGTTPKKPNLVSKLNLTDSRSIGRLNNIRKTPSKAPTKLNDKRKKNDKNWFDSDNFFGVMEP